MRDSTPVPARPSPTHVADSAEIIAALEALAPTPGAVLAFDADGTIWAGDVAEDAWNLARKELGTLPRAVNFISGPSHTGDIEQTIVLGAHGPYRVHLVIVEG